MNSNKNKLWDVDAKLFASMKGNYVSANEENFFKNIQFKQEYECTLLNDLLVSEYENADERTLPELSGKWLNFGTYRKIFISGSYI